jgi:hypothetical protein
MLVADIETVKANFQNYAEHVKMRSLCIGINAFPNVSLALCANALRGVQRGYDHIELVQVQFPWDSVTLSGFKRINTLRHSTKDVCPSELKQKPFVREIFTTLAHQGCDDIMFLNCDCIVTDELMDKVMDQKRTWKSAAISRSSSDHLDVMPYFVGQDCFVMPSEMWFTAEDTVPYWAWLLSEPAWDSAYTMWLWHQKDCEIMNQERLLLHKEHAASWSCDSMVGKHMYLLWKNTHDVERWNQYMKAITDHRAEKKPLADEKALQSILQRKVPYK